MNRLIILTLLFLTSCGLGMFDHWTLWEDDTYAVNSTDGNVRLVYKINDLGGSIGRVSGRVLAIGSNEKYVVAKRKQDKFFAELDKEPITDELMFYYIERAKDGKYNNGEEIVKGPFSLKEFLKLKVDLNLPDFSEKF